MLIKTSVIYVFDLVLHKSSPEYRASTMLTYQKRATGQIHEVNVDTLVASGHAAMFILYQGRDHEKMEY